MAEEGGGMKIITSTNGHTARVSNEDFRYLTRYRWTRHPKGYFQSTRRGTLRGAKMHRIIAARMGLDIKGLQVDHIDRDPYNNQRRNLRIATSGQNRANSGLNSNNKSGYKGVHFRPSRISNNPTRKRRSDAGTGTWYAQINVKGRKIYLGRFKTAKEAHQAYREAALKYFGEFANPAKRNEDESKTKEVSRKQ